MLKPFSIPAGVYPSAFPLLTKDAISSTPHSPQAVPLARRPNGVNIIKTAIRIYNGLNADCAGFSSNVSGDIFSTNARIAVVRTISAIPNNVRCPIIIAGIEIVSGYGQ